MAANFKKKCEKCGAYYNGSMISRHEKSCKGVDPRRAYNGRCPYCEQDLGSTNPGNHVRWCSKNPKAKKYREDLGERAHSMRNNLSQETLEKRSHSQKELHSKGFYSYEKQRMNPSFKGRHHSEETKKILSEKARSSKHRRLVKSCRVYTKSDGSTVLLDSSWEELVARRLDELKVVWERPRPIEYILEGTHHNYFPDFYLPEYDLYLDPKNPQAFKVQAAKIEALKTQIKNLQFILTEEECRSYDPRSSHGSSKAVP